MRFLKHSFSLTLKEIMDTQDTILLAAFKFVTGDNVKICRLCFDSVAENSVLLDEVIYLQKPYVQEYITLAEIFLALEISTESCLPEVLCLNCSEMAINSYLLQKLSQHSNMKWDETFNKFNQSLNHCDTIGPNIRSVYLFINKQDNVIFTSKKRYWLKDKKTAASKIREIAKSRTTYNKVERQPNIICEECGQRFRSKCYLIKHMQIHRQLKYGCKECPKIFSSQLQLQEHVERLHSPKRIHCPKCPKRFSTERMLRYHEKLHHVAAVCRLCMEQFPSRKCLRAHLDKHEVQKCSECNKSFTNKHTYKFHLKICGKTENRTPNFFCDICNKGYVRKNGLRTHLKTEHGFGDVLTCKWCGKKYDAESRLRNHIVKHTRERNYHCELCGNRFVTQAALVYHTRLHTGEKPFKCNLCNESFLSASRRMEHKKRKHFEPTKKCPVCSGKFVTGHQLQKHLQRHYNPRSRLYAPEALKSYTENIIPLQNLKQIKLLSNQLFDIF